MFINVHPQELQEGWLVRPDDPIYAHDAEIYLRKRIDEMQREVAKSDQAVEDYRRRTGLLRGATSGVTEQQLTELNTQLILAQAAQAEAESRLREAQALAKRSDASDTIPAVLSSPTIQNLKEQQLEVQRKIADMATRLYVADSMAYRTAGLLDDAVSEVPASGPEHDAGLRSVLEEYTVECPVLKVFGTECLDFVADEALQILGGYGFLRDYPIERHYRDSRINRIFEGTNEVNRLIIPATLLKRAGKGQVPYFAFVEAVPPIVAPRKVGTGG